MALAIDNPFWRFSLDVYAGPGVAAECLALQDGAGLDVNILLFAAWLGFSQGRVLKPEDVRHIADAAASWSDTVVKPLRTVRRHLKSANQQPLAASEAFAASEALRKRVAEAELAAEQIEQAMLHGMTGGIGSVAAAGEPTARTNVACVLAHYRASEATYSLASFWTACTARHRHAQ